MNRPVRKFLRCACGVMAMGLAANAETSSRPAPAPSRNYYFDRTISRETLENYLSRSITMEDLFNGRGDLDDNLRMLKSTGAKYIGRSLCLWNGEARFLRNLERAKQQVPKALASDPEMILEACVFETVSREVEQIPIPDWVFIALSQPVEQRNFVFTNMIYAAPSQRRPMGRKAQVPDESRIETQLWFYYQAASYIDAGFEGIHFGQVEIMNKNDPDNVHWAHLLALVRDYAAQHARRHMVLCDGHVPTGGLMRDGNPLLDFNAFPLRIMETPDKPEETILKLGFSDGLYNKSKGGRTFSGWTCDHLPYFVEFDNYGVSQHPGEASVRGRFNWVWGYDEITWFAHQPKAYRAQWLQYAWDWIRATDTNGYLEMPGSRTAASPDTTWYFANNPSPAVPNGLGDEEAIRAVWARSAGEASATFDGKTLNGWEGNTNNWRVENGAIVAGRLERKQLRNEFLATTREFGNFDLRLQYRVEGSNGFVNGGVQFWSQRVPNNFEVSGYQADLGAETDGNLYDESRRNRNLVEVSKETREKVLKRGDWNDYRIRAENGHIQLWLNGVKTVDYLENDKTIPQHGIIALQIHGAAYTKVQYRNLILEELPARK